jgi:hypothetical protein
MEAKLTVRVVSKVEVVNLYHTSSSGSPVAHPTGMLLLAVATHTVPELFVVPLVRVMAPLQLSLAGGPATVISKSQLLLSPVEPAEYTRT